MEKYIQRDYWSVMAEENFWFDMLRSITTDVSWETLALDARYMLELHILSGGNARAIKGIKSLYKLTDWLSNSADNADNPTLYFNLCKAMSAKALEHNGASAATETAAA